MPAEIARGRRRPPLSARARHQRPRASNGFIWAFRPLERDWILRQAGEAAEGSQRRKFWKRVGILARPAEGGSHYDRFKGRLLFSIHDAQGRPVGIGGRVLPELGADEPGQVRQFAGNAAVHQEQAALWARPGPRSIRKTARRW